MTGKAVAAPPMRLVAYNGCQDLLAGLRAATEKQVGPYGLPGGISPLLRGAAPLAGADGQDRIAAAPTTPDHSGTNVQEAGVDEPDLVKTDGRRIVVLAKGALQVIDAASRKVTGKLDFATSNGYPRAGLGGADDLLVNGDRALVIAPQPRLLYPRAVPLDSGAALPRPLASELKLYVIELSGAPRISATITFDGTYVAARQVGSVARIVARSTPHIDFPPPQPQRPGTPGQSTDAATEANRQAVRRAPLTDWLPQYDVESDGAKQTHQVPCEQVSHPPQYSGTSMLTVLTLNLGGNLTDPQPVSVVADGQTVYASAKSLYVSHTSGFPFGPQQPVRPIPQSGPASPAPKLTTDLYKFDISAAGRPRYLASGSVPGTLLSQYSMSEYGGNLQVASTDEPYNPGTTSGAQTSVHVLAEHGPRLDTVGGVGGLGKGERVYAVRFLGPVGYVVTFRQMDPLYTVDLHDPAHPAVTGELKLNGYSAYLHPISGGRLLGVGQDATSTGHPLGTQVSLFDVTGKDPRRLTAFRLPDSTTEAQYDPHAFLYWPQSGLTVLPVMLSGEWSGEVLALTVTPEGVHELGTIRHPSGSNAYVPQIRRSLIIGGTLWTFSDAGAQANDAATLGTQSWLPF